MSAYTPEHLTLWTQPDSWFGKPWNDHYSAGVGQTRDSGALDRSNFACAWKAISGVSDRAVIVSENHWACGWVEWIAIPADDRAALEAADKIVAALADYPVLDDSHLSELEQSEANEVWEHMRLKDRIAYMRKHRNQFEFRSFADLLGCARGNYFAGYASELLG